MSSRSSDLVETFQSFLTGCARFLMVAGGLATLISLGLLIFTGASASSDVAAQALRNVEVFRSILSVGLLGLGVGASYLMWGEDVMVALQLMGAAALFFFPLYFPLIVANTNAPDVYQAVLESVQQGGMVYGIIAIVVTVVDIAVRTRERVKLGVKKDQLKYGRGVKEEDEKQNVLLGKCWQLPFCRKFVRERCPIYHAKTTCWKELVGCMCEEAVIRNAMENRPIPKDSLLAAKMIPQNAKLTVSQKKERCRSCVIFNEHQRHKYKVYMPTVVGAFILTYVLVRTPALTAVTSLTEGINRMVRTGTLGAAGNFEPPRFFVEMLLAVFFIIALTYSMKLLEYLIFRAKV